MTEPEQSAADRIADWVENDGVQHPTRHDLAALLAEREALAAQVEALKGMAGNNEIVEAASAEAFWTDDIGGHHKAGTRAPHTWENIPAFGRENYRTLVRAVLVTAVARASGVES